MKFESDHLTQQLDDFIGITGLDREQARKYIDWGKGNLEIALNYFYTKQDKPRRQQSFQVEQPLFDAFNELKQGSLKQHNVEKLIRKLKEEYDRPIAEQLEMAKSMLKSVHDTTGGSLSYFPPLLESVKEVRSEPKQSQIVSEAIPSRGVASTPMIDEVVGVVQPLIGKRETFTIHASDSESAIQVKFPLIIGSCKVKAQSLSSQHLGDLQKGMQLKLVLEQFSQQTMKKPTKFVKAQKEDLIMRLFHQDKEIGRLERRFEVILGPLIIRHYVKVKVFYEYSMTLCKVFDPIHLNLEVYLTEKALTRIDDRPDNGDQAEDLKVFLETRTEFMNLFQLVKMELLQATLIQYEKVNPPLPEDKERSAEKQKPRNEAASKVKNAISDPYVKPAVQTTLQVTSRPPATSIKQPQFVTGPTELVEEPNETQDIDYEKLLNLRQCQNDELVLTEPSSTFKAKLFDYQKQALTWMLMREGVIQESFEENYRVLHPLWQEYRLSEARTNLYFNPFSGQVSVQFPRSSQKCKGGILADEMGLGKTVMLLGLIHSNNPDIKARREKLATLVKSRALMKKQELFKPAFSSIKQVREAKTLVVVPLVLIDQWEKEAKTHSTEGSLSIYKYYGAERLREDLSKYDLVITTYGTISSEYRKNNAKNTLFDYDWFRIILDEAHYIKGRVIQIAQAIYNLNGYYRWCATGTPIQNKLDELFSLVHFIKLEPWSDYHWWNTYINKQFERGQQQILEMISIIIKPVLLRRTKQSKKTDGSFIISLPKKQIKTHHIEFSQSELDLYKRMEQRSQEEFEGFMAKGILMSKYMQMFELILRLRQMCDHPFLILTRSDVKKIDELERTLDRFLFDRKKSQAEVEDGPHFEIIINDKNEEVRVPIRVEGDTSVEIERKRKYKEELLTMIKANNIGNCPICLEHIDDAVVTICLHLFCRMCMKNIMRNQHCCAICRQYLAKEDVMSLPRENEFSIKDWQAQYKRSAKINQLFQILQTHILPTGDKCVIFTQFIGMIELIQHDFEREGIPYLRLDGKLSSERRTKVIQSFNTDAKYQVFLVSLKTGGVGLNLTVANHVVMIDPWWNPAVEDQAVERVHRIGQTKEVFVHRLIIKNSIEERILEMHKQKKYLFDNTISSTEDKKEIRLQLFKQLLCF